MNKLSFLKDIRSWKNGVLTFVCTIAVFKAVTDEVHILINRTESLPYRVFIKLVNVKPKKGEYTALYSSWYQGRLIKQIIGKAGDGITYDSKRQIYVNNHLIEQQKTVAVDGRVLHPLLTQIIPESHVFLYAPHKDSFDSRYQELGLVKESDLQGRLIPVI